MTIRIDLRLMAGFEVGFLVQIAFFVDAAERLAGKAPFCLCKCAFSQRFYGIGCRMTCIWRAEKAARREWFDDVLDLGDE
jgi:hypothetical protein